MRASSSVTSSTVAKVEVDAEPQRELPAMRQSSIAVLRARPCDDTLDPAFRGW